MLYYLLYEKLFQYFSPFRIIDKLSVRSGAAAITAFLISIIFGPYLIRKLYMLKIGQEIRKDECPPLHLLHKNKQGTPTIGGLLILASVTISSLLWMRLDNLYTWLVLFVFIALGALGFVDDYLKVKHKQSLGLRARSKLIVQVFVAVAVAAVLIYTENKFPLYVPFYKFPVIQDMGVFFVLLAALVIVGASNAVNLTDGLDGLAIGTITSVALSFTALAWLVSNVKWSGYLNIYYVPQASELTVFCAALVGAGLGFLWYNAHPAMVFMGDTGSLALGGAVGIVALLIRKEILLLIIGGIFVIEA
ncbi:MAG: phospho-N-acetylmuramoyl-pentapeptide-transferase, partial [Chlamydiae bacterium]